MILLSFIIGYKSCHHHMKYLFCSSMALYACIQSFSFHKVAQVFQAVIMSSSHFYHHAINMVPSYSSIFCYCPSQGNIFIFMSLVSSSFIHYIIFPFISSSSVNILWCCHKKYDICKNKK